MPRDSNPARSERQLAARHAIATVRQRCGEIERMIHKHASVAEPQARAWAHDLDEAGKKLQTAAAILWEADACQYDAKRPGHKDPAAELLRRKGDDTRG
jgi:hypothetical protein